MPLNTITVENTVEYRLAARIDATDISREETVVPADGFGGVSFDVSFCRQTATFDPIRKRLRRSFPSEVRQNVVIGLILLPVREQVSGRVSVGTGLGWTFAKVAQDISQSVIGECGHLVLP
jgi:hypothetical protein